MMSNHSHVFTAPANRENGNILFLILLAVVLFAALAYAVTSSMRGGGKDGSDEKSQAIAAQIAQYATLMEQTVTRLRLSNNCSDTQISFENSVVSGYTNASAPSDKRCHVFDTAGGGMSWQGPIAEVGNQPWVISGSTSIIGVGTGVWSSAEAATAATTELIMFLPITSAAVCARINQALGNSLQSISDWVTTTKFTGTYAASTVNRIPDDPNAQGVTTYNSLFYGKTAGCAGSASTNSGNYYPYNMQHNYFYYHVLIAR